MAPQLARYASPMDSNTDQRKHTVPTASAILDDGSVVEMVSPRKTGRTVFAIYSAGRWTLQDTINVGPNTCLAPFSPSNNLIKNDVVLLPSEPSIYGSEEQLLTEVQQFIHRHVDFDPSFEKVATYYVLLTWLYDAFNELPYLRRSNGLPQLKQSLRRRVPTSSKFVNNSRT